MKTKGLTHFDQIEQVHKADAGKKPIPRRAAIATSSISIKIKALSVIRSGTTKKGDGLNIARIAATMGAKRTSDLIPLCYPLTLTHVHVDFNANLTRSATTCTAQTETLGRTGVEIEARAAAQAALTIYDRCKSIDRSMVMTDIKLVEKHRGKSGKYLSNPIREQT